MNSLIKSGKGICGCRIWKNSNVGNDRITAAHTSYRQEVLRPWQEPDVSYFGLQTRVVAKPRGN